MSSSERPRFVAFAWSDGYYAYRGEAWSVWIDPRRPAGGERSNTGSVDFTHDPIAPAPLSRGPPAYDEDRYERVPIRGGGVPAIFEEELFAANDE